jgi:hypothetical protein
VPSLIEQRVLDTSANEGWASARMTRSYSMTGVRGAAARAVDLARSYLHWQDSLAQIHDVQEDPRFQQRGVDLLWQRQNAPVVGVEVKGDRQAHRGNYFFELISNLERETPGCFLYSSADLLLYVFLSPRQLHQLPLPATREWFLSRATSFELRTTRTRIGPKSYTTVGALVPVREVLSQVAGAIRFNIGAAGEIAPYSRSER